MKKKSNINATVTVCGALSPTGPGAKYAKNGGGPIHHVEHGIFIKKKKKTSGMTVAESMGDLGDGTHHVGP